MKLSAVFSIFKDKKITYMVASSVFIIGLVLSFFIFMHLRETLQERERIRFEAVAKQSILQVKNRMEAYRQILYSGVAFFNASSDITREEWHTFVESMQIGKNFPGIQGVGYAKVIRPSELQSHTAKIRKEGFENYSVIPSGDRELYTSIIFLEPFDERNRRAFGYDMYSESVRKEAMDRAMTTGAPAMSGKVRLVQENNIDEQAGFLVYIPVYKKGAPLHTKEQRMGAIEGFVYAPFRIKNTMSGVLGGRFFDIDLEIYDGESVEERNLMLDTYRGEHIDSKIEFTTVLQMDGRSWTLIVKPRSDFAKDVSSYSHWFVLLLGLGSTITVSLIIIGLARLREKAQELADEITKKLSASEERLSFALEGSRDGVWDWNIADGSMFYSKRWKEMLGFGEEEIGTSIDSWESSVHPDDINFALEQIQKHFRGECDIYTAEYRMRRKDGVYKWVLDRGMVVARGKEGEPQRMVGSLTDITAQKEAEAELKRVNDHLARLVEEETAKRVEKDKLLIQQSKLATMGEMIGAIGHQWRQPLNSLGLMIQDTLFAYKYGEMDEEYLKHFKDNAMSTIQAMSKTIDDFKNFFSPNKKEEQFFIEDAISQTIKILEAQLKNNSIEMIFDIDLAHKHSYVCYKNELNQVVLNLLANSKDVLIEKKPKKSFIKIDILSENDGYLVSIEDSGGGIPEDIIEKIFEPYFTTKGEDKGTGIGLYMSKNIIVEHLGGKLTVKNTQNGAKFEIWLPRKED